MATDSIINCYLVGTTERDTGRREIVSVCIYFCVCVCVFGECVVAAGSGLTLHFCCVSGSEEKEDA